MVDVTQAVQMYKEGVKLRIIGERFGVSRQRIGSLIKQHAPSIIGRKHYLPGPVSEPAGAEHYVCEQLRAHGFPVEPQWYNSPFDILVGSLKIEVKHRTAPTRRVIHQDRYSPPVYNFSGIFTAVPVDFYVFVCGELEDPQCYVIPAAETTSAIRIADSYKNKSKYGKYLGRWDLINIAIV